VGTRSLRRPWSVTHLPHRNKRSGGPPSVRYVCDCAGAMEPDPCAKWITLRAAAGKDQQCGIVRQADSAGASPTGGRVVGQMVVRVGCHKARSWGAVATTHERSPGFRRGRAVSDGPDTRSGVHDECAIVQPSPSRALVRLDGKIALRIMLDWGGQPPVLLPAGG